MEMKQCADFLNSASEEVLGVSDLVKEDLSNVADIGTAVFNANSFDHYVKALVDRIGKTVFVTRKYRGRVPSVVMDGFEFGAVLCKLQCELPEATENESWELEAGTSYDPNVFTPPVVTTHFWNKRCTFQVKLSITSKQFLTGVSNANEANAFIAMIYNAIDNSMTIKMDALIMKAIANMIGETVYDDFGANAITGGSHVKAVNALYLYNQFVGADNAISADEMCKTPEFIRFTVNLMTMYKDRLASESTLFNIDGKARFTPDDRLHFVVLSEFASGAKAYLQSDTYHKELVALPDHEIVPYWQGSGQSYSFTDTGKIYVTTDSGHDVTVTGILGVMFDSDAVAVMNVDRRTTSMFNPRAEFTNVWYKMDGQYVNSCQENFVVFYGAVAS